MKNKFLLIALFSVIVFAFPACTIEKSSPPADNLDLAIEEVFVADLMEDVMEEAYNVIFDESEYGILKSEEEEDAPDCKIKTVERPDAEVWTRIVTIDFGDGCEDKNGNIRKGKIIIVKVLKFKEEGSTRTVTFEDYYVNDNKIEGTKVITNTGRVDGFLVFSVELDHTKITTQEGVVITRNASKTRTWIEGEDTPIGIDNVFLISGIVNKVNRDGVQITKTITDVVRARDCRWPLSGIVEITTDNEWPDAVLDYGDGECDKWATVTIGEGEAAEVWTINLREKGIKWRKKDE
ncbi:hypothetical protein ACFLTU_00080 [Bacteroidota bacterium]